MNAPDRSDTETLAWLTLLRAPALGPAGLRGLVARAGSAAAAVAGIEDLRREFAIDPATLAWLRAPDRVRIDADAAWLAADGRRLLTWLDADYPALLREAGTAPAALFVDGDASTLWLPQIAVVGARSATAGGLANARSFAAHLAGAGLVVTSGLADGVDAAAHAAALDAGRTTIAVMGTGPDLIYPRRQAALAGRIRSQGALVTEFPPGVQARPDHFPRRNRIIAGLSLGVLVIEAGVQSGSLITARLAVEQGKEVFAIPGSIHSPQSRGAHALLRQGAKLVETAQDVLEELRLPTAAPTLIAAADEPGADAAAPPSGDAALLAALGADPVGFDALQARTGLPTDVLQTRLLELELDGQLSRLPGGLFQRLVRV